MKPSELRNKSIKELNEEVSALLRELFNLRTQRRIGQSKQTHQFNKVKRDIARVKTIISEKEGSL